jgi:hypothetical protein
MFFPSYTYGGFDSFDNPFGSPFPTRHDILRAREMERRKRIQQQQQSEMERRKRLQEMQREERMERQRRERERCEMEEGCYEERYAFPPGTILRGRDGRLYRVVARPAKEQHDCDPTGSFSDDESCSSNSMDKVQEENVAPVENTLNATANEFTPKSFNGQNNAPTCRESNSSSSSKNKKTLTLVVEDVPLDEDDELRELHSIWRNRVPEPGQWMEPVESFDRQ